MSEQPVGQKVVVTKKSRVKTISQTIYQNFLGSGQSEARDRRNRQILLERVKKFWIEGVLEKSLYHIAAIDLGFEQRLEAISQPWDMVLEIQDYIPYPIPIGTKVIDIFDRIGHNLMILGEPGSSKTTILLQLARDAIARAEKDNAQPLPVILNLSSWTPAYRDISEWLVDELNFRYFIPEKVGRAWITNDELLLLLDGLDEVRLQFRESCAKTINQFHMQHGLAPLVVTSRINGYNEINTLLMVQAAIEIQPLKPNQVQNYLNNAGQKLEGVRIVLKHDFTFRELVKSPLMLNVMALAYKDKSEEEIQVFDSIEKRRKHIFDTYVWAMFNRVARTKNELYPQRKTVEWLAWLAQKMEKHNQAIFTVDHLQSSWLNSKNQVRLYKITTLVIFGLIIGLGLALINSPVSGLFFGLLLAAFYFWAFGNTISPITAFRWSFEETQIVSAFGISTFFFLALAINKELTGLETSIWLEQWFPSVISRSVIVFIFIFLISWIGSGITTNMVSNEKPKPNWAIWQSGRNAVMVCLILPWISFLFFGLPGNSFVGILPTVGPGANGSFIHELPRWLGGVILWLQISIQFGVFAVGGVAFIQHFTLRTILNWNRNIPWLYVRFLDFATERIFLQKIGGSYIFIHRFLQEYFADMAK